MRIAAWCFISILVRPWPYVRSLTNLQRRNPVVVEFRYTLFIQPPRNPNAESSMLTDSFVLSLNEEQQPLELLADRCFRNCDEEILTATSPDSLAVMTAATKGLDTFSLALTLHSRA